MSQIYTFTKIFTTSIPHSSESDLVTISKIVIPRIQRPYAQGRKGESETKIRESFLKDIFKHLKNGQPMDMNFVYGTVKEVKVDNDRTEYVMELLDGQQRFTTLYLLHWYLLNKEYRQNDPDTADCRKALASFIYQTRATATDFCKSLAQYSCSLDDKKPSECISHARWYYRSYDRDSTIAGMLVMLDAIDECYKASGETCLLDKIELLQFYVLPLMQYNMSEELYMKMNARGLPLSVFDNFKADFTSAMKKVVPLQEEMVQLAGGLDGEKVSHSENISIKLDAQWIDLFWDENKKKDADRSYMRFFSRFFACRYLIDSPRSLKDMRNSDVAVNMFYTQTEKSKDNYLGFEEYGQELDAHPDYFTAIEKVLDTLQLHQNVIAESLIPVWGTDAKGNFFVDANATFSQTLLAVFGAITEFILTFEIFEVDLYRKWMRVVWNIVENTDIDNLERVAITLRNLTRMIRAIAKALGKESEYGIARERVYEVFKTDNFFEAMARCADMPTTEDGSNWTRVFREELEKAKRINEDEAWLKAFTTAEAHPYLKGTTCFFYTQGMELVDFERRSGLICNMFDENGIAPIYRKKHLLIRALMSQLTTWKEIEKQYITENSELHKFLKILLIRNEKIHEMIVAVLDASHNEEEVLDALKVVTKETISYEEKTEWGLAVAIACNSLRKDVKLYNWMLEQPSPVYVHVKNGHIAVAIPGKWYDRFFIDSEREKMACSLMEKYEMQYFEDESAHTCQTDYDKYGRYKGEDVVLYRNLVKVEGYSYNVLFGAGHRCRLFVEASNKTRAKVFRNIMGEGTIYNDDPKCVYLYEEEDDEQLWYYTSKSMKRIIERIDESLAKVEAVMGNL